MLRPTSSLSSGRVFDASMASRQVADGDLAPALELARPGPSRSRRCRRGRGAARATPAPAPAARRGPRCPSRRGWRSARWRRRCGPGRRRSTQNVSASASTRTSGWPHTGQSVGNVPRLQRPCGRSASTGPTTSGITSPARRTIDDVAGPHVLGPHLVLVVQRRLADGDAADEHRLEHGERRGPTGAPDRHEDVEQLRGALLGRELEGDRPARRARRRAQLLALARARRPSRRRRRSRSRGRGGGAAARRSGACTASRSSTTTISVVHRQAGLLQPGRASRGASRGGARPRRRRAGRSTARARGWR